MMPSLIIADPALQTLPVRAADLPDPVQQQLQRRRSRSYLMAMAPAIIVYLFTQRWVMAGVTQGAVKG